MVDSDKAGDRRRRSSDIVNFRGVSCACARVSYDVEVRVLRRWK